MSAGVRRNSVCGPGWPEIVVEENSVISHVPYAAGFCSLSLETRWQSLSDTFGCHRSPQIPIQSRPESTRLPPLVLGKIFTLGVTQDLGELGISVVVGEDQDDR